MANQNLGLDASKFFSEMTRVQAALQSHSATLGTVTQSYVKLSQSDSGLIRSFRAITEEGNRIVGTMREVNGSLEPVIAKIAQVQRKVQDLRTSNLAQAIQAGAGSAQGLVQSVLGTNVPLTPQISNKLRSLQQQIAAELGKDPQALSIINEQIASLRKNELTTEVGQRDRLQGLAQKLLLIEQLVSKEKEKQARRIADAIQNSSKQASVPGTASLESFKASLQTQFPAPSNISLAGFQAYSAALSRVIDIARAGKVPLSDLQALVDKLRTNPFQNLALGGNAGQAQVAIQGLVGTFNKLQKESDDANNAVGRASRGITLSLQNIARIVQIQLVHRFFGNLITEMQQSVGAAANFDVKLTEVLTLGRAVASVDTFRETIRSLAIEFNRQPTDVAEGVYQALSNQIIKTSADLGVMRNALELARATASTTADGVNALSAVLNAYHQPTSEAARISDQLFRAVDLGKFRLGELASNLGRATVTANSLGIALDSVLAFLTITTRSGVSESEALTQLTGVMQALEKPTKEMKELFKEWGVSSGEAAVATFTFTGVLQRLRAEQDRIGGSRIPELFPNVRGARGVRAVTDTDAFEQERASINRTGGVAQAGQLFGASIGNQFKGELNKIQTFLETDFGPRLLKELLNVGSGFGGFAELAKSAIEAVNLLVIGTLRLTDAMLTIGKALSFVGVTLPRVAIGMTAYFTATRLAGPITTLLSVGYDRIVETATGAFTAQATLNARLAAYTAQGAGASAAQAAFTRSQLAAVPVAYSLSAAMSALTLAIAPLALFAIGAGLLSFLNSTSSAVTDAQQKLQDYTKTHQESIATLNRQMSEGRNEFTRTTEQIQSRFLQATQPLLTSALRLRDTSRAVTQAAKDDFTVASKAITDFIGQQTSHLREQMKTAEHNIRDSFKNIQKEKDQTSQTLFQAQLGFLQQGVISATPFQNHQEAAQATLEATLQEQVRRQQILLIQQRIGELQQHASEDVARNDREGIEASRTKYAEIKRLTEQQFQLETENRRQQQLLDARSTPGGRTEQFFVNFEQLRRRLEEVNTLQAAGERTFQNGQAEAAANAATLLQFTRDRERVITESQHRIQQFSVTNAEGVLNQNFRGPEGSQRALTEFDRLVAAARQALQAIRLTDEEVGRLQSRLGEEQTAVIERALSEGTITDVQVRQLEGTVTQTRLQALQDQLRNFTATQQQIRDFDRATTQQRNAIAEQLARERVVVEIQATQDQIREQIRLFRERDQAARESLTANVEQQSLSIRQAQEAAANILQNASRGTGRTGGLFDSEQANTARANVRQQAAEFQRTLDIFNTSRTDENAARAKDALAQLTEAYRQLLLLPSQQANFPQGLSPGEFIRRQLDELNRIGTTLTGSTTGISEANRQLQSVQTELNGLNVAFNAVNGNLNTLGASATQVGAAIDRSLGSTANSLGRVADQIASLANQLQRLGAPAPFVGPLPQDPFVGPLPQGEGFAEGGLIGGKFTGQGPDNRIIAAKDGEFIVNSGSTRRFYSQIMAINAGFSPRHYSEGGLVGPTTNVGDVTINVQDSGNSHQTAREIHALLKREFRTTGRQ